MPQAEATTVIDRPQAEVFAFLADAENDPKWRPGVLDIAREGGGELKGPVRPEGRYELSPSGSGTRVRFTLGAELAGAKKLLAPMVQKTMNSEVAGLERLKRVLESEPGSGALPNPKT